jgi:hypothetical protein
MGAVYASQKQSAKSRAALQAIRLTHFLGGYAGRAAARPALMHRRTYQRLVNQLLAFQTKSGPQAISKFSHKLTKPTQMYRTQLASIENA